jgi:hypothetical protein
MGTHLMSPDLSLYIALAAFALNFVGTIVGVTWKLTRVEIALRDAITAERREIDGHMERQSREFGETAAALRQKIHEVEVWSRDTFVRSDGFQSVKNELSQEMKDIAKLINQRLERIEANMMARP